MGSDKLIPVFRQPQPQDDPGRMRKRYAKDEVEERFNYLDRIDRRCDANSRRCYANRATRELTVQPRNPSTGMPMGEIKKVKVCSVHRRNYERSSAYEVLGFRMLIDRPDPKTGKYEG